MDCVVVIAVSAAIVFARTAIIQELNPFLWAFLAFLVYIGAPMYMIWRGAAWMDAPWVWISSFGGLFVLFVVQSIVAANAKSRRRGRPVKRR